MRFLYHNTPYRIRFQYSKRYTIAPGVSGKQQDTTQAIIEIDEQNGMIVAAATVARHYKDKYDRNAARKFALREALSAPYPKDFRAAAWEAYHKRPGGLLHQVSEAA